MNNQLDFYLANLQYYCPSFLVKANFKFIIDTQHKILTLKTFEFKYFTKKEQYKWNK